LDLYQLQVDWIIAYGGAVVANGKGDIISITPLGEEVIQLQTLYPEGEAILFQGRIIQYKLPKDRAPEAIIGCRKEVYENTAYFSNWKASKLHATHKLLKHLNWDGSVQFFGDGIYDQQMLSYFDGLLIKDSSCIPQIRDGRKEGILI
jgi:hydroxymethylpyrimidine pyrophosphatase-like HAD family hydrolase